jgi:hypothetical protein
MDGFSFAEDSWTWKNSLNGVYAFCSVYTIFSSASNVEGSSWEGGVQLMENIYMFESRSKKNKIYMFEKVWPLQNHCLFLTVSPK